MEMYKKASKEKLRIQTSKGLLSVEQLWDLSISSLDKLAVELEKDVNTSERKSFIQEDTEENKKAKFKFDLVLDILKTKVNIKNELAKAAEIKTHNQRILSLIAEKKDSELANKSVDELEKMLK